MKLTKFLTTFFYFVSHKVILNGGPIAYQEGGQMRLNITRGLSDRLYLRTYQDYFINSSGYILYVMNFIS